MTEDREESDGPSGDMAPRTNTGGRLSPTGRLQLKCQLPLPKALITEAGHGAGRETGRTACPPAHIREGGTCFDPHAFLESELARLSTMAGMMGLFSPAAGAWQLPEDASPMSWHGRKCLSGWSLHVLGSGWPGPHFSIQADSGYPQGSGVPSRVPEVPPTGSPPHRVWQLPAFECHF